MKPHAAPVDFAGRSQMVSAMSSLDVRKAAIAWYVLLCSGEATEIDRARWQAWIDSHADHRQAWERIEAMRSALHQVPQAIAVPVLRSVGSSRRRTVLRAALGVLAGTGTAGLSWQLVQAEGGWRRWTAEQRTAVGETRVLALDDGSRLVMNTGSALNLRFDASRRLVQLVSGEVWIQTAARRAGQPPDGRPFLVATPEGMVQALGTRFTVRSEAGRSTVTVLRDAVEVRNDSMERRRLEAGEQAGFTTDDIGITLAAADGAGSWEQGSIVVSDGRLGDLVAELARYRHGRLACDARVADLRVSGAFPIANTDRALAVLARSLPVRLSRLTDYWVTVVPA